MTEKYNGNCTANARINIDYRKGKPDVKFSYPDLKNQSRGSMFVWVWLLWMALLLIGFSFYSGMNYYEINYKGHTAAYLGYYNGCMETAQVNPAFFIKNVCESYTNMATNISYSKSVWDYIFPGVSYDAVNAGFIEKLNRNYSYMLLMIMFVIPLFFYFPFRKFWNGVYPRFNSKFHKKRYITFLPENVEESNGRYYVEIPLFNNVQLNYEALDDFSKYLEEFDIREHGFMKIKQNLLKPKAKEEKIVDEWIWRVRWYFSEKPVTGKLDVEYTKHRR